MMVLQGTSFAEAKTDRGFSYPLDYKLAAAIMKKLGIKQSPENVNGFMAMQNDAVNSIPRTKANGKLKSLLEFAKDVAERIRANELYAHGFVAGLKSGEFMGSNFIGSMLGYAFNAAKQAQGECSTQEGVKKVLDSYGITDKMLKSLLASPQKSPTLPSDITFYFASNFAQLEDQRGFMQKTREELDSRAPKDVA